MRLIKILATDASEIPITSVKGRHTPAYSLNFVVSHFAVEVDVVEAVVLVEVVVAVVVPPEDLQQIFPGFPPRLEQVILAPRYVPPLGHARLTGVSHVPVPPD